MKTKGRAVWRLAGLALVGLVLAACVGPTTQRADLDPAAVAREAERQRELALRDYHAQLGRLYDVGFPVLTASVPLCGEDVTSVIGVRVHNKYDYEDEWRATAQSTYALGERLRFLHIAAGSPAAAAGLRAGEILVAIEGTELHGKNAATVFSETAKDRLKGGPATLNMTVSGSDGVDRAVSLDPVQACNYDLQLELSDAVNAMADGKSIVVTSGMMLFARNDTELATVVAHELAHNAMGHIDAMTLNAAGGLVIDILAALAGVNTQGAFSKAASQAYSQEFEAEADYVGVYALALAGYDFDRSPDLWRRMAVRNPGAIDYASSHPTAPARFLGMEEAVSEIHRKQGAGALLRPEIKPRTTHDAAENAPNPFKTVDE